MRNILRVIGMITFFGSGAFMFIFWVAAMSKWLGGFGLFLALFLAPGLVVFPAIYWIVEGVFPVVYFAIWGLGFVGTVIFGLSSED